MKLRSYMRGLGIGIVVTALIMGIATKNGRPLTDAEIKAAAAKLGMVESNSLKLTDLNQDGEKPEDGAPTPASTLSPAPDPTSEPDPLPASTPESTLEPAETPTSTPVPTSTPTPTPAPTSTPPPTSAPTATSTPISTPEESAEADTVKITVKSGTGSRAVCNQLAEAGLIEDAAAFDQYLIDSGYSKRISAGTFEIPIGASEEEIAKIISKSR